MFQPRAAAAGAAAPPKASATKVATTAVLARPAPHLIHAKAKAFFRLKAPARLRSSGDASIGGAAAPAAAPAAAVRRCLARGVFLFSPSSETVPSASGGRRCAAFGASSRNGADAGAVERKNALAFFRAGGGEYRRAVPKGPTPRQRGAARRLRLAT